MVRARESNARRAAAKPIVRAYGFAIARTPRRRMLFGVQQDRAGKAIVIVDDERPYLELIGGLLGDHFACPIVTYVKPLEMLDAIHRLNIGVLVTDYYMPRLNGYELARRVGAMLPAMPCLVITGHALDEEDEDAPIPANIRAILPKPFRWQELAALIEKHWPAGAPLPLREGCQSLHR